MSSYPRGRTRADASYAGLGRSSGLDDDELLTGFGLDSIEHRSLETPREIETINSFPDDLEPRTQAEHSGPASDTRSLVDKSIKENRTRTRRLLDKVNNTLGFRNYVGWQLGGITHDGNGFAIRILAEGTPEYVSNISTAYHVLINIFATILLSASNFCMQVLSSPVRQEIDKAHKKGMKLDVEILSFYNLPNISRTRHLTWWIFLFSSLPLHLFYNSTISDTTSGRQYDVSIKPSSDDQLSAYAGFHNWTDDKWYTTYNRRYVPKYGDLYLFVDMISLGIAVNQTNGSFLGFTKAADYGTYAGRINQISMPIAAYDLSVNHPENMIYPNISWSESTFVDQMTVQNLEFLGLDGNGWINVTETTLHVKGALSTYVDNGSKVQIVLPFMLVVIVSNILKMTAMWYVLRNMDAKLLVTIGDAIQSFLHKPDPLTTGYCMSLEKDILQDLVPAKRSHREVLSSRGVLDKEGKLERHRKSSRYQRQLIAPLSVMSSCIIGGSIMLSICFSNKESSGTDVRQWGTASQLTLDFGLSSMSNFGILYNTWLSNMPQILLSSVYFFFNRLLTQQACDTEWGNLALHRKHLRVSKPEGEQRGTHFLQLPYRIAIPMMVYSGILHWLLSQAIFLRRLEIRDPKGSLVTDSSMCTIGYSPVSFLVFVVMATIGAGLVLLKTWYTVPVQGLPLGANSSIIISAACHPPPDEVDAHLKAVKWGVVKSRFLRTSVQHCTLTSEEVEAPVYGNDYA